MYFGKICVRIRWGFWSQGIRKLTGYRVRCKQLSFWQNDITFVLARCRDKFALPSQYICKNSHLGFAFCITKILSWVLSAWNTIQGPIHEVPNLNGLPISNHNGCYSRFHTRFQTWMAFTSDFKPQWVTLDFIPGWLFYEVSNTNGLCYMFHTIKYVH